ncbi:MAG: hypothetical protein WA121_05695 [Syntrophales bacterium]
MKKEAHYGVGPSFRDGILYRLTTRPCPAAVAFIQGRNSRKIATLDQNATLVETTKRDALYSYQGYSAHFS